jgi:hypothetical protein
MSGPGQGQQASRTASPQYRQAILEKFENEVAMFREGQRLGNTIHRQLKSATKLAAQEYGNRFLVELIQNAHDALPADDPLGRVRIVLDLTDGPFGTLMVANTGAPFSSARFVAICEFAQSSKLPGESIGNKGVGFRSVLQISDWPEVYSRSEVEQTSSAASFDGFCFRFAHPDDLVRLTSDRAFAERMETDVSAYSLPVPIDEQPKGVEQFAKKGFASVIRLPLRSTQAADAARAAFNECIDRDAPLSLFLGRLHHLDFEYRNQDEYREVNVVRSETRLKDVLHKGVRSRLVTIDFQEGDAADSAQFFVATSTVTEGAMRAMIEASISTSSLPEGWRRWKGSALVSVAVSSQPQAVSRFYNYLPMGAGAASPFTGFLDAPFYAKLDRTSFDESVPLNNFLLNCAARTALSLAQGLIRTGSKDYAPVVARLVAWKDVYASRLLAVSAGESRALRDQRLFPIASPKAKRQRYAKACDTFLWGVSQPTISFTPERLTDAIGVAFLDPRVDQFTANQLGLLRKTLCGSSFEPTHTLLADWAEALAEKFVQTRAGIDDWDAFYSDLSTVFVHQGSLLQGRRLLLDDSATLRIAGTPTTEQSGDFSEPTVFLAPVVERTEGEEEVADVESIEIPEALKRFVRYAHPELRWRHPVTGTSNRLFFVQQRLVRRFGRRELKEFVRALLSVDREEGVYSAALEFVFRLVSSASEQLQPPASELGLRVPVRSGEWVSAKNAVFSDRWNRPLARSLDELILLVAELSPEMKRYGEDLLQPPERWPFPIGDLKAFSGFLALIGVNDGIWPWLTNIRDDKQPGWAWRVADVGREIRLAPSCLAAWANAVNARREIFAYPNYQYKIDEAAVWSLPGQDTYSGWPSVARHRFAELIATSLGLWDEGCFWIRFSKVGGVADIKRWPSPVLGFLDGVAWIPLEQESHSEELLFGRPGQTWFVGNDDERLPGFLPQVEGSVTRALRRTPSSRLRLRMLLNARNWDNVGDAALALETMGRMFAEGLVDERDHGALAASYQQKWHEALTAETPTRLLRIVKEGPVVVRRGGALDYWKESDSTDILILLDEQNPLRRQLIEQIKGSTLAVEAYEPTISSVLTELRQLLSDKARLSSEIELTLIVEGQPFLPSHSSPLLRDSALQPLGELFGLLLAARGSGGSQRIRQRALDSLFQARAVVAQSIEVAVTGLRRRASAHPEVIAYPHDTHPTLVATQTVIRSALSPKFAHPLAELVGLPALASNLELALHRAHEWLAERAATVDGVALTPELVCHALEITTERLREIQSVTQRSFLSNRRLLLPVICYAMEEEWSDEWQERVRETKSFEELEHTLAPVETRLHLDLQQMFSECKTATNLSDIRDRLGLEYARFNSILTKLGGEYKPILDNAGHESAFKGYLAREYLRLQNELRQLFWSAFETNAPLTDYVKGRELQGLSVDSNWLEKYALPPESEMHRQVQDWLSRFSRTNPARKDLPDLYEVRAKNKTYLDDLQIKLRDTVLAWCKKKSLPAPQFWLSQDLASLAVVAFAEGWTDFDFLSEASVIGRLVLAERWPAAMPQTLSPADLGIGEAELTAPRTAREEEHRMRDVARRSITVDGKAILIDRENYRTIADAVLPGIDEEFLATSDRATVLEPISGTETRRNQRGTLRVYGGLSALSDEQRLGIGFIGELVVREWLRRKYPLMDVDECWKSSYKNAFLGRQDGDDGLGYDFEVLRKSRRILYEVKASTGEDWQFALGESEVRSAQRASGDKSMRYRILFVENAVHADRRRLFVLPNPFTAKGAHLLRMVGAGMRFRFLPPADLASE